MGEETLLNQKFIEKNGSTKLNLLNYLTNSVYSYTISHLNTQHFTKILAYPEPAFSLLIYLFACPSQKLNHQQPCNLWKQ